MRATSWDQARACVELVFEHDTRAALPALGLPSLVVVGERESVFARGAADELRALVPGAEFAIAPEVSHLHPLSRPEWLAGQIEEWVTAHENRD